MRKKQMEEMLGMIRCEETESHILDKRTHIKKQFVQNASNIIGEKIVSLTNKDLNLMFCLYDKIFFNNWFRDAYKGLVKFSLSKRMTRSAGQTICPKNIKNMGEKATIEVRIGVHFFYNYDAVDGPKIVSGIETKSSIDALQLVFEHEICHVIEFILYKKSSCRGKRFNAMAYHLFRHVERYHKLPSYRQIASEKYGLDIGDRVMFKYKEKELSGLLYKINKRAVVLVKDRKGKLADVKGTRYAKYYVDIKHLKPFKT